MGDSRFLDALAPLGTGRSRVYAGWAPHRGARPERWGVGSLQVTGRFPGLLAALHRPVTREGRPRLGRFRGLRGGGGGHRVPGASRVAFEMPTPRKHAGMVGRAGGPFSEWAPALLEPQEGFDMERWSRIHPQQAPNAICVLARGGRGEGGCSEEERSCDHRGRDEQSGLGPGTAGHPWR